MNLNKDRLLTPSDLILIGSLLFISIASIVFIWLNSRPGEQVTIEYDGGEITKPLKWSGRFELKGPLGVSLVKFENGKVRMVSSPCPTKTCVHTGWISKKGQTIVCVPNHITIKIDGKLQRYDAISR